jgi:hypothetical protein
MLAHMYARLRRFTITAALLGVSAAGLGAGSVGSAAAASSAASVTGTIVAVNGANFLVKTAGSSGGGLNEMIAYATKLQAKNCPYVFGGGHGAVGVPSGAKAKGFDCSAVVAAVLASGGLWPKHTGVPGDAGVIQDLLAKKLIGRGPASGPYQVALFDDPNKDIQMRINGRFFGTGVGSRGGAGWVNQPLVFPKAYKEYHVLPSALGERSSDSDLLAFSFGNGAAQQTIASEVTVGAKVQVSFAEAKDSLLVAQTVTNVGGTPFHGASSY